MIEVNLVPGAKRRPKRSGGGGAFKALSMPDLDQWLLFMIVGWVLGLGGLAFLFLGTRAQATQLTAEIAQAEQDSINFAATIAQTNRLRAQRDTISQKLEVIQQIDEGRYVWPHVMEEVSRALPDYTWLEGIMQLEAGEYPVFQIDGRTGNNFALTRFMSTLEASPFIRNVRLLSTQRAVESGVSLHSFLLEAQYEEAPSARIETVPLFADEASDGTAAD